MIMMMMTMHQKHKRATQNKNYTTHDDSEVTLIRAVFNSNFAHKSRTEVAAMSLTSCRQRTLLRESQKEGGLAFGQLAGYVNEKLDIFLCVLHLT